MIHIATQQEVCMFILNVVTKLLYGDRKGDIRSLIRSHAALLRAGTLASPAATQRPAFSTQVRLIKVLLSQHHRVTDRWCRLTTTGAAACVWVALFNHHSKQSVITRPETRSLRLLNLRRSLRSFLPKRRLSWFTAVDSSDFSRPAKE